MRWNRIYIRFLVYSIFFYRFFVVRVMKFPTFAAIFQRILHLSPLKPTKKLNKQTQ